jgi:arylsulfatase A-like enzyme
VFTSDHGDCLGDHHQVYKFSSHYDPVARVPLVMSGPGVQTQGIRDQLVELIDLGPSLLDLAGLPPLDAVDGQSLRPLLEGSEDEIHNAVFSEHGHRVMIRTHDWKLVLYLGEPLGELYHLTEDPDELHNLYNSPEAQPMRAQLIEQMMHWYGTTRMRRRDRDVEPRMSEGRA